MHLTGKIGNTGGQDAGKWVFYLEERASERCHVLAVESEHMRDKWLYLLEAAADPEQAEALIQGLVAKKEREDAANEYLEPQLVPHRDPGESDGSKRNLDQELVKEAVVKQPGPHSRPNHDSNGHGVSEVEVEAVEARGGKEAARPSTHRPSAHRQEAQACRPRPTGDQGPPGKHDADAGMSKDDAQQQEGPGPQSTNVTSAAKVMQSAAADQDAMVSEEGDEVGGGMGVVGDSDTLAKFAQRWKLEAEKMAALAQSSLSAQAKTAKEKEQLEAEVSKMRAQAARARFLEDDQLKSFKDKTSQFQEEVQTLKSHVAALNASNAKDSETIALLQGQLAEEDQETASKNEAAHAMARSMQEQGTEIECLKNQVNELLAQVTPILPLHACPGSMDGLPGAGLQAPYCSLAAAVRARLGP